MDTVFTTMVNLIIFGKTLQPYYNEKNKVAIGSFPIICFFYDFLF